ncbi:hypothetical protein P154DRAFT_620287 [Amniculicola lignicola CBS 123094]|uniref:Uncharacterized protein n=1 Tax=Amniculicola lignicola CBS 123094 TaxID=1392246 RepID=A0A6A5WFD1_9PLEO|nr:hypothetical protein P154DRAFT_620287 [Amniculicola lignicola CBS 123094]
MQPEAAQQAGWKRHTFTKNTSSLPKGRVRGTADKNSAQQQFIILMHVPVRLSRPLQRAALLFPRATWPNITSSLLRQPAMNQKSTFHCPKPVSLTHSTNTSKRSQQTAATPESPQHDPSQEAFLSYQQLLAKWALDPNYTKPYDTIHQSLKDDAIRPGAPWGLVVFRVAYGSDTDAQWARMLEEIKSTVVETMSLSNRADLLAHHELTVVENAEALAGADSHTVRHAFRAWVAGDLTPRLLNSDQYGDTTHIELKLRGNDAHWDSHPVVCVSLVVVQVEVEGIGLLLL